MKITRVAGLVAGGSILVLAAACNGQQTAGQGQAAIATVPTQATETLPQTTIAPPPAVTTTVQPTTTTTTTTAPPPVVTTTRPVATHTAATPECTVRTLSLKLGPSDDGMGHHFQELDFTNVSGSSCFIIGFPGVSYVDYNGHQVGAPAERSAPKGGRIVLKPGQVASADVSMTSPAVFDPAQCKSVKVAGLRVYPPDSFAAMFVSEPRTACTGTVPGVQLVVQTIKPGVGVG